MPETLYMIYIWYVYKHCISILDFWNFIIKSLTTFPESRFLVLSFTGTTFETIQENEAESQVIFEEQRINVIEKDFQC